MANSVLLNQSVVKGTYRGHDMELTSNISEVQLVSGLTAVKTADKYFWADGQLTYSVVVTNNSGEPFITPLFLDTLDTSQVRLVPHSITENGVIVTSYYYDEQGRLSFNIATIPSGGATTIRFSVSKG